MKAVLPTGLGWLKRVQCAEKTLEKIEFFDVINIF